MDTKKTIETLYDDYVKDYHTSQRLFDELIKEWKYIRDNRGIHMGTTDDYYLGKVTKIRWELEALFYRNSNISRIEDIYKIINKMLKKIKTIDSNYKVVKIYL